MQTLPADVRPAKITRSPVPANDTNPCWTAHPRAALLLASLASNPPARSFHKQRFGFSVDEWFAFEGYRVEALTAVRDQIGERHLAFYDEHGQAGYEPFRQFCHQPSVTEAITAAIAARGEG